MNRFRVGKYWEYECYAIRMMKEFHGELLCLHEN